MLFFIPNGKEVHHRLEQAELGHHEKNAIGLPSLRNHSGSEDLELNLTTQPAFKKTGKD